MSRHLHVEIWIGESQEYRDSFDDEQMAIAYINAHVGDNWNAHVSELKPCGHYENIGCVYDKITGTLDKALKQP